MLAPASNRAIVARILRNLKGVYSEQEDMGRALRCADRLIRFDASQAEDWRDRGLLYLQLGIGQRASEDLARYLQLRPEAGDAEAVREAMIDAAVQREDFSLFHRMMDVLSRPFEDQPDARAFAQPPLPHERVAATFCGT